MQAQFSRGLITTLASWLQSKMALSAQHSFIQKNQAMQVYI
jgi:hypothetical protein